MKPSLCLTSGLLCLMACAQPVSGPVSAGSGTQALADAPGGGAAGAASLQPASLQLSAPLLPGQKLIPDPSWSCGMPEGIPDPATGQFAFDIDIELSAEHDIGATPLGHRIERVTSGGTVDGQSVRGLLTSNGLEYELSLDNGVVEIEQILVLKLGDEVVFARNCGIAASPDAPARVVLDFEAATGGAYAFLNTGRYVALRDYDPALRSLRLKVYDVGGSLAATEGVQVVKLSGVPTQSWACMRGGASSGAAVFSERVIMAQSQAVGDSKRGARNIMTIADGSLTGKLTGRVLPGGGDYQLFGADNSIEIDARYVLETSDGELIVVRNCGRYGEWLTPRFETRTGGPYAWLNQGQYASSDPAPDLASELLVVGIDISEAL